MRSKFRLWVRGKFKSFLVMLGIFDVIARRQQDRIEFITERRRPKFESRRHKTWCADPRSDTAIVLQGPIWRGDDFTVESVRRYRTNFPNAPIIVSTWTNEIGRDTERIEDLGGIVVHQEPPPFAGISNQNLQLFSSRLGVLKAEQFGVTHVIKSRTDQRCYSERMLGLLHQTLSHFPLGSGSDLQEQRVIGLSFNTFAYRMYGLSDMFTFGTCADSSKYWDGIPDMRKLEDLNIDKTIREFAENRVCEVKFCSEFLSRTGWDLKWTLEDSWKAFAERFVILDASSVDLYWPKHSSKEERNRRYDGHPLKIEIDFAWWLMIYGQNISPDETILDFR
jgi:hypothetical protein